MFKGQLTSGNLEIIFRSTQGISYCRFTDTILIIPCALLSSVIYEYKCTRCSFRYIGLTYRYWEKRLKEHLHMLALTGKPLQDYSYLLLCFMQKKSTVSITVGMIFISQVKRKIGCMLLSCHVQVSELIYTQQFA